MDEVRPYSVAVSVGDRSQTYVQGYKEALKGLFWVSAQARAWFGEGNKFLVTGSWAQYVDVLIPKPGEYQKPVFLSETRVEIFERFTPFSQGDLLKFLSRLHHRPSNDLKDNPHDNIFLLQEEKIAVVHWLPVYGSWQLHVTEDWPFMVNPGTRIYGLQ